MSDFQVSTCVFLPLKYFYFECCLSIGLWKKVVKIFVSRMRNPTPKEYTHPQEIGENRTLNNLITYDFLTASDYLLLLCSTFPTSTCD